MSHQTVLILSHIIITALFKRLYMSYGAKGASMIIIVAAFVVV